MTSELVQATENSFNPPTPRSESVGKENLARVLGGIADRAIAKSSDYAAEASKTNLLQTNSMLKDIEANSKLEMLKSPGHAEAIAKNAEQTTDKLKSTAVLNRADRLSLDLATKDTVRGLNFNAAEKSISITNQAAKYATLSAFGNTLQSIREDIFKNPEHAQVLIEAQYASLAGQVKSGIITAVEGANLHKQLEKQVELTEHLIGGLREGVLDASDVNMYHAASPSSVPMSNAHLPITHDTQFHADHYHDYLTNDDIKSKWAQGIAVSTIDLTSVKKIDTLEHLFHYGAGAMRANGDLMAVKSWPELKNKLALLTKTKRLNTWDEGYRDRLNNFFSEVESPGGYEKYIDSTPEGARAAIEFSDRNSVINSSSDFGTPEKTAAVKTQQHVDSLNDWVRRRNAIGIGADWPDNMRQPIPLGYLNHVDDGFKKGGDVNAAIANIQVFDKKNRVYILNHFKKNPRKALTVYEIGNLGNTADEGFLEDLFESQQVGNLGDKEGRKDSQDKFLQLAKGNESDRSAYSDEKLAARISTNIPNIRSYLSKQPGSGELLSAKIDQALRYIKHVAANNNDYTFEHLNDYIKTYSNNMEKAYGVMTGFNFVTNSQDIPLDQESTQVLASHSLNVVKDKLLEYKSPAEVETIFANRPPILVSSPGGRLSVVFPDGSNVPDKNGNPAYSHLYTEGVWRHAEHDNQVLQTESEQRARDENGFIHNAFGLVPEFINKRGQFARGEVDKGKIVRPLVEGNINLENRPKVYNKNGDYETVKTITSEIDGKTVLLPTIINGKEVSKKEAVNHYLKTGEHLGVFKNQEQADKYDEQLHIRHGWIGKENKWDKK